MRILVATIAALLAFATPALAQTAIDGPSGTIADSTPQFTFAGEAGARFDCRIDPGYDWRPCTSPYGIELPDGSYTFSVRATDRAGNVEQNPPSRAFTIDTAGIDTRIDAGPGALTNDATPSFTFSSTTTGATFECSLTGGWAPCSSPYTAPKLTSGAYTLRVRAKSPAGKLDATPADRAFTLDADPPDTRITGGPAGETPEATPTFTYDGGNTYECRLDSKHQGDADTVAWKPCAASGFTTPALTGGAHTFDVRAIDPAGNVDDSPASRRFTVRVCEPVVRFGLIEATGDCLAQVGTEDAPKWESTGPVNLNGLPLPVVGGSKIVLTKKSLEISDITLAVAGVQLYHGSLSWDLPDGGPGDEKELKSIDLSGAGEKLFGMKVEGKVSLRLRRPGDGAGTYKSILALHVALPEVFKSGPQPGAGSVTGDVAINIDRQGVHLDGLKIAVANAYVGSLGVKSICLSFASAGSSVVAPCQAPSIGRGTPQPYIKCANDNTADRWDGALAIVLPTASHTELGFWGGLRGGKLANVGGYVDNLGTAVPLAPGVFLQSVRLGVCLEPPPFQVKGGAAVSFGPPGPNGNPAVRLDADFRYQDAYNGQPWLIRADGSLTLFDKQVATAYMQYQGSGLLDFGFDAHLAFGPAHVDGGVAGWIETRSPSRFNVKGNVNVCVDSVACAGGELVASTIGAAACLHVTVVSVPVLVPDRDWSPLFFWRVHWENRPVTLEGGAGYTWQTHQAEVMVGSCSIGKWVLAQSAQAGANTVIVGKNEPAVTIRAHGVGAPPKVDLVGPGGRRISTPDRPGGEFVKDSHVISENPADDTTTILVAKPAAGAWRVEARAGSTVTAVDHAMALPQPSVVAGVQGHGHRRTLAYTYVPQPGQKVTFVERGPHTAHVLGVARPGRCREAVRDARCGKLRFRPARGGAGMRRIVAVIEQDRLPRENLDVATFRAPRDARPGRPRLVRARRAGAAVVVRWQPVDGFDYAAEAIVSDGRRLAFSSRHGFRIPAVSRRASVRIAVRSVRTGEVGAPARLTIRPKKGGRR